MTTKTYRRSRERFETASEAWDDIEERSDLVGGFDQYLSREHTGNQWVFVVRVDE